MKNAENLKMWKENFILAIFAIFLAPRALVAWQGLENVARFGEMQTDVVGLSALLDPSGQLDVALYLTLSPLLQGVQNLEMPNISAEVIVWWLPEDKKGTEMSRGSRRIETLSTAEKNKTISFYHNGSFGMCDAALIFLNASYGPNDLPIISNYTLIAKEKSALLGMQLLKTFHFQLRKTKL